MADPVKAIKVWLASLGPNFYDQDDLYTDGVAVQPMRIDIADIVSGAAPGIIVTDGTTILAKIGYLVDQGLFILHPADAHALYTDRLDLVLETTEPPTPATGFCRIYFYNNASTHELKVKYDNGTTDVIASK